MRAAESRRSGRESPTGLAAASAHPAPASRQGRATAASRDGPGDKGHVQNVQPVQSCGLCAVHPSSRGSAEPSTLGVSRTHRMVFSGSEGKREEEGDPQNMPRAGEAETSVRNGGPCAAEAGEGATPVSAALACSAGWTEGRCWNHQFMSNSEGNQKEPRWSKLAPAKEPFLLFAAWHHAPTWR